MLIGCHGVFAPTALRCSKKSSRCSLARFFRPLRMLHLAASATGGAQLRTPYPSPVAGEGPSGQIAAYPTHSLDSETSCYRFAETKIKCAAGTLRAYLRRCTDDVLHRSYPAAAEALGGLGAQPQACFGSFYTSKRNAPAASRTGFAPCKISAPPLGGHKLAPKIFYHFSSQKSTHRRVGKLTPSTRLFAAVPPAASRPRPCGACPPAAR